MVYIYNANNKLHSNSIYNEYRSLIFNSFIYIASDHLSKTACRSWTQDAEAGFEKPRIELIGVQLKMPISSSGQR